MEGGGAGAKVIFPSMKGRDLLAVLCREPLGYSVERQNGSHRTLTAPGRPALLFAFHDGDTLPRGMVRKILVHDVGLAVDEAKGLIS